MTWTSGLFVYALLWWLVLFMVLPWGVRQPDVVEEGHMAGAPDKPRMWMKLGVTTVIAAALWLVVFYIIEADLISFHEPV
ncbi:MAG: DUF1467 family protein [Alphaproteobacteria bacterium]|nr:DUF1467 family protein [Alphaproteobacteria bacterium]